MVTRKSELSRNNKYWIPKERFNELVHFCYQYPGWLKALRCLDSMQEIPMDVMERVQVSDISDPVAEAAEAREYYNKRIAMVDRAAELAHPIWGTYILDCATEPQLSYDKLNARITMPMSRHKFYELYRAFFWYLSQLRE